MWRSLLLSLVLLVACGSSDDDDVADCSAAGGGGGAPGSGGSPSSGGAAGAAGGGVAHVRLFNFIGPVMQAAAVDVCVQPVGAAVDAWTGPLFRDAHTFAKYGSVTPYVALPPGRYRLRAVPWGASECEATMAGLADDVDLPSGVVAGGYHTVVLSAWLIDKLLGVAAAPLEARLLRDHETFDTKQLSVRFLNMDPGIDSVDVWKAPKDADPATWQLVMAGIAFGEVGLASTDSPFGATDEDGYLLQQPKDWPVALLFNTAVCPHGVKSKDGCYLPGMQTQQGNVTIFTSRSSQDPSWKYSYVSDGAKLFDTNQPRMVTSDDWW